MPAIILIDTSVFLNVLDIPGYNQQREQILNQFREHIINGDWLFLPTASIWETGDHITDNRDGRVRRQYANLFVTEVSKALKGNKPYTVTEFPDREEFLGWLGTFPDSAMRSSSKRGNGEGTSLSDHSIIKEWEKLCQRHPMSHVLIWSLDADLSAYNRQP
ncbi:hypothetical protein [Thiothrix sp.]|jgi:hypothetical protein|uniref:hypothetical protein n=1 Tax=Thiothrix sp. TaxID=1032 RepID=UPI00257B98A4|nr:hypothetical protein [Thiothrix sp.]